MTAFQLLILALVQGITEFLPISSSAHLILVPVVTNWPDQGPVIDVAVHLGTLLAVLLYFRRDTIGLTWAGLGALGLTKAREKARKTGHGPLFWALVIATLPVLGAGFALKAAGGDILLRSPTVIAWASIIFALLLYWADHFSPRQKTLDQMKIKPAVLIGLAQILALIPGASRAGITITAARKLGFVRQEAARFSMLLSIPTILGAGVLTMGDIHGTLTPQTVQAALFAGIFACVAALAAIHLFMKWLERASMTPFVIYRIALGVVLLTLYG